MVKLKHVAPFPADYPTLGLVDVQPGQRVEVVGKPAEDAVKSGNFERVAPPKPQQKPAAPAPKSKPAAPAPNTKEGE